MWRLRRQSKVKTSGNAAGCLAAIRKITDSDAGSMNRVRRPELTWPYSIGGRLRNSWWSPPVRACRGSDPFSAKASAPRRHYPRRPGQHQGCGDRLLKSVLGVSWRSHNHFQRLKLAHRLRIIGDALVRQTKKGRWEKSQRLKTSKKLVRPQS